MPFCCRRPSRIGCSSIYIVQHRLRVQSEGEANMKKGQRMLATASLVVLGISAVASQASAFLRVPQVPVLGGTLQGYLNSKGEAINVSTDQQDAQVWSQSASGNG